MVWYYRDGEENKGPFSDEEIEKLVGDRTVKADTWVWREGMEGWKKYEEVAAVDGSAKTVVMASVPTDCQKCGKTVGLTNLRPHDGKLVCADCLAELKAAAQPVTAPAQPAAPAPAPPQPATAAAPPSRPATPATPAAPARPASSAIAGAGVASMRYASIADRAIARLIDFAVIFGAVLVASVLFYLLGKIPTIGVILNCILGLALFVGVIGYEVYFLGRDGATPGKKMRNIRVVRSDGSDLDTKQAVIRVLSSFLSGFLFIGYILAIVDEPERKSLHDRLADTRVVQA
ncbi:MAG TPA: RDD family protein [Thermoanaerobaculia bacterium]|nr:RDD family protein [Thermoanaerobaculia bacterium]